MSESFDENEPSHDQGCEEGFCTHGGAVQDTWEAQTKRFAEECRSLAAQLREKTEEIERLGRTSQAQAEVGIQLTAELATAPADRSRAVAETLEPTSKEWEAALARARKMKTCIPDGTVRGRWVKEGALGAPSARPARVRDFTVEDLARWMLGDRARILTEGEASHGR